MTEIVYGPRYRSDGWSLNSTAQLITNGVPGTSTTFLANSLAREMNDVVTESFKTRVQSGEIINNPMDSCSVSKSVVPCQLHYVRLGSVWEGTILPISASSTQIGAPSTRTSQVNDAIVWASTKAMGKVSSEITQSMVTLGELKETREMLRTALHSMLNMRKLFTHHVDVLFDLSKTIPKRAAGLYKHLESSWMQIRMGWRPLAGEVDNTLKAWNSIAQKVERKTFRSWIRIELENSDVRTKVDTINLFYADYERKYREIFDVRSGVLCSMKYGGVPDTWGVTKFPQTVWELTTLSWLCDYFFNVADIIAAYTPDSLWETKARWTTTHSVIVQNYTMTKLVPKYGGTLTLHVPADVRIGTVRKQRIVDPDLGIVGRPKELDLPELLDTASVVRQKIQPVLNRGLKLLRKIPAVRRLI